MSASWLMSSQSCLYAIGPFSANVCGIKPSRALNATYVNLMKLVAMMVCLVAYGLVFIENRSIL